MKTDRDQPLAGISGRPVDPSHLPTGCPFAPRCPRAQDRCRAEEPPLADGVACWYPPDTAEDETISLDKAVAK